jgi:hypothetical protein
VNEEDDYYYARQRRRLSKVTLPVYRIILKDEEQTRYYLDPNTGTLLQRADETGRWRRWLFSGLHRLDFTVWMRTPGIRDVLMWLTCWAGLAVSITGVLPRLSPHPQRCDRAASDPFRRTGDRPQRETQAAS